MNTPTPKICTCGEPHISEHVVHCYDGKPCYIKPRVDKMERIRQLEQELSEAGKDYDDFKIGYIKHSNELAALMIETIQLRKVVDELAAKLKTRGESDWSSYALASYNQLPHIKQKETK